MILRWKLRNALHIRVNSKKSNRIRTISKINMDCATLHLEKQKNTQPLVTFGVLTDIQYADADNGMSYDMKRHRYYRNSLNLVRQIIANWKQHEIKNNCKFKFFIQLGDIIDLKASIQNNSEKALETVITELDKLTSSDSKLFHLWGNHEMYNFQRKDLVNTVLNTAKSLQQNHLSNTNCYTFDVTDNLRLICLDFYKFSLLGYEKTDSEYIKALQLIQTHNKNDDLNSPLGLSEFDRRWCRFNGSLGEEQLKWLSQELFKCQEQKKKAIVCGHIPVHIKAAEHLCLAWDYKQILETLWSFDKTVIAYFAGHYHDGGYFKDEHNIHHITFRAILETKLNTNSYATVRVFNDRVCVENIVDNVISNYDIQIE